MNEDIRYPQISQISKASYTYRNLLNTPCIVQEKLDGCNFRIICRNGKIVFGSRTNILQDDTFCNFGSIKDDLLDRTEKLSEILNTDFMIVGELIGYNKDKLIIPRIKYFDKKEVKFYAFEIYDITKNVYMDFVEVQELLNKVGFNTIPYETSRMKDLNFKSTLFPGVELMEGYILRYNDKRYKIKSEEFLTIETGESSNLRKPKDNSVMYFINNSAFFNYISKGYPSDAQKFHEGFCKEIIEDYLAEEDSDGEKSNKWNDNKKKEHIKNKANEIFSRVYGVIKANNKNIDDYEKIFSNYDIKKAKEKFLDFVKTV